MLYGWWHKLKLTPHASQRSKINGNLFDKIFWNVLVLMLMLTRIRRFLVRSKYRKRNQNRAIWILMRDWMMIESRFHIKLKHIQIWDERKK